ncbi:DUF1120 domain-containing protein [Dyella sp. M7H15-1]|uniref:DUF1120 domain-containing protein n=1 Tax=Dyella sp. M7H15-1 TaxID=2501295 RepID=UPI0010051FF7|nr:DUF1120 domain-containing protein [Dyella sp. M7H15-1]QAU24757.1 DUF1120 domain-containing protein [Dyella sp. M7H15-1]
MPAFIEKQEGLKMLKKTIVSGFAAAALMAAPQLFAAGPTTELKVMGVINPPDCSVSVGNNGVFDVGAYSPNILSQTNHVQLNTVSQSMDVSCDANTHLTFQVIDNQAGSESTAAANNFGFGFNGGTNKIGYYQVGMSTPTVDGQSALVFSTSNPTSFNASATATFAKNGQTMGWASANNTLSVGKAFQAMLTVTPWVAPATMIGDVSSTVPLNGSLTLNFDFAI